MLKMNIFTIEKVKANRSKQMSVYNILRAPLLVMRVFGAHDAVHAAACARAAKIDLTPARFRAARVLSAVATLLLLALCYWAISDDFVEILHEFNTHKCFTIGVRVFLTLTYAVAMMSFDDDKIIALVERIQEADELLCIERTAKYYSPSLGVNILTFSILANIGKCVLNCYNGGIYNMCINIPWALLNLASIMEILLCACIVRAMAQRIILLARLIDSCAPESSASATWRPDMPLDTLREVVREFIDIMRSVNLIFRRKVLVFICYAFFSGLYYEKLFIMHLREPISWTYYLLLFLLYSKSIGVVMMFCWIAEELSSSKELVSSAIQRRIFKATSNDAGRSARDLLRLVRSTSPDVFSLYGLISVRLQLVPTFFGLFASYSVVIIQLGDTSLL